MLLCPVYMYTGHLISLLFHFRSHTMEVVKVFSGSASKHLALEVAKVLGIPLPTVEHHVFPDGEQRIQLREDVVDQDVVVIQSTGIPTDQNYIELFLLLDAASRNGAKSVTAVIP